MPRTQTHIFRMDYLIEIADVLKLLPEKIIVNQRNQHLISILTEKMDIGFPCPEFDALFPQFKKLYRLDENCPFSFILIN